MEIASLYTLRWGVRALVLGYFYCDLFWSLSWMCGLVSSGGWVLCRLVFLFRTLSRVVTVGFAPLRNVLLGGFSIFDRWGGTPLT